MPRTTARDLGVSLLAVMVFGAIAAYGARDAFHADALAYARIATYYAHGDWQRAVSMYWSPLFSWLLIPLASLFPDPVHAGRAAMLVSGLVFALGSHVVLVRLCADDVMRRLGTLLVSVFAVTAIGHEITPDLLMAGLFAPAIARLVSTDWLNGGARAFGTGLLLGLACLAKSVALPAGAIGLLAVAIVRLLVGELRRRVLVAFACTGLGLATLAVPWIATMSVHAGTLTLGSNALVNLTLSGPSDVDRFHPTFRVLHVPPPGRISTWEAPEAMPYRVWSPFDSRDRLTYWLSFLRDNAGNILQRLAGFDLIGLGLVCAVLAFFAHAPWRQGLAREPWRWSLCGVALPIGLYVPFFASSARYYNAAYPFLLVAALGVTHALVGAARRTVALLVVGIAFLGVSGPSLLRCVVLPQPDIETLDARVWGRTLQARGRSGPIAAIGPNGHTALYAALFVAQPFVGNVLDLADTRALDEVGARVVFVKTGTAAAQVLAHAATFARVEAPADASARNEVYCRRP